MSFAPSSTEITVDWKDFEDRESSIISYHLELMMQTACNVSAPRDGDVIYDITVDSNVTSYTFKLADEGIALMVGFLFIVTV